MKLVDLDLYTDKQKLLFFILLLIIFFICAYLLFGVKTSSIDYKNMQPSDFINSCELQNDRKTYWILDDIVATFIGSSVIEKTTDNNNISYVDYYQALDEDYQKYLGKSNYLQGKLFPVKRFFDKFRIKNIEGGIDSTIKANGNIDRYYKSYDSDRYICILNTVTGETYGYIGIELNTNKNTYKIFYLK